MSTAVRSKLLRSNAAGWLMAMPAFGLVLLFLVVPFVLAFALSFTNQRLVSPNPTEFVGLRNFEQLLSVNVLQLEPERDAASGEVLHDETGAPLYPAVRSFTRNNPGYRQY